jgi:hypothetical protein
MSKVGEWARDLGKDKGANKNYKMWTLHWRRDGLNVDTWNDVLKEDVSSCMQYDSIFWGGIS